MRVGDRVAARAVQPADQHVVAGIALERVVKVRTGQVLDIDEDDRLPRRRRSQIPVARLTFTPAERCRIGRRIGAAAAVDIVRPAEPSQNVVAGIADQMALSSCIARSIDRARPRQHQPLNVTHGVRRIGQG